MRPSVEPAGLSIAETAAVLGISTATVSRDQAAALEKMRSSWPAPASDPELRRLAFETYCTMLMQMRPYELPDCEPPPL